MIGAGFQGRIDDEYANPNKKEMKLFYEASQYQMSVLWFPGVSAACLGSLWGPGG